MAVDLTGGLSSTAWIAIALAAVVGFWFLTSD